MRRLGHRVCVATMISGGKWTVLAFNLLGQAMLTNQGIPESLQNDSPCRQWLHLLHKLIKYTNQALLGIAVLLMDGVHGDFGYSQHASKCLGLRLDFKYFTDHLRNIFLIQRPVFERVSLCKRKAENSTPPRSPTGKLIATLQTLFLKVTYLH